MVHRAVEGEAHRLGTADAAVAHLLPHEVAVAQHARQNDVAPGGLGDAQQRADDLGASRRLLEVVLDLVRVRVRIRVRVRVRIRG